MAPGQRGGTDGNPISSRHDPYVLSSDPGPETSTQREVETFGSVPGTPSCENQTFETVAGRRRRTQALNVENL